ncbi:hypothetical protein SBBP1_100039 [Burkholderiales bacterium]|nr:hypothetical protein SBBP1_100039 [Burkholderiales bacterium]
MPEGSGPELSFDTELDQASGLRRIFDQLPVRWSLVLQPSTRSGVHASALAGRARQLAADGGDTLVIDAARSQVALPLGLRLRYDLQHALAGDCEIGDACVAATEAIWVLPAARALDKACTDERHASRVAAAVHTVARDMRQAMLILPAARVSWIHRLPELVRLRQALIPVLRGADAGAAVLTAVSQAVSEAQIDTFHLLFLGMGEAAAGRLLSGMAAIAQRHFGATLLAAKPLPDVGLASKLGHSRHRPVESVF